MTLEERSEAEIKPLSDLALEYTTHRLQTLGFLGSSLSQRLTVAPGRLLSLDLDGAGIMDLTPLERLPIGRLSLQNSPVADLEPLRRLPLLELNLIGTKCSSIDPLGALQLLAALTLRLSAVTNLSPLRGLHLKWLDLNETRVADLSPLQGMSLDVLRIRNTLVRDLSPLAGMPLFELDCTSIPALDFSPLARCEGLTHLWLVHTAVRDLSAFRQCKLRELRCDQTAVGDLSPLAGMPLTLVRFFHTEVTDVTPLLECPTLRSVGLSSTARNIILLRALPNLLAISDRSGPDGDPAQTAAEFWESRPRATSRP